MRRVVTLYPDVTLLIPVVGIVTLGVLIWKERPVQVRWLLKAAIVALVLALMREDLIRSLEVGVISGLLWEILTEIRTENPAK